MIASNANLWSMTYLVAVGVALHLPAITSRRLFPSGNISGAPHVLGSGTGKMLVKWSAKLGVAVHLPWSHPPNPNHKCNYEAYIYNKNKIVVLYGHFFCEESTTVLGYQGFTSFADHQTVISMDICGKTTLLSNGKKPNGQFLNRSK